MAGFALFDDWAGKGPNAAQPETVLLRKLHISKLATVQILSGR
jgi:hypothetical protein